LTQELTEDTSGLRISAVWAISPGALRVLVRRWNWKSRNQRDPSRAIFFSTNLAAGRDAAVGAMLPEACYRMLLSGASGR